VTQYFTRDSQTTEAGWDLGVAYFCFSGGAGGIGAAGEFPDRTYNSFHSLNDLLIFTDEASPDYQPNLDGDATNVGDYANQTLDLSLYATDKELMNLFPFVDRDANGVVRKNTPGCMEAGNLDPATLNVDEVRNNAVDFSQSGKPVSAVSQETEVVELVGTFASPFDTSTQTPTEPTWTMTGLEERIEWQARYRWKSEFNHWSQYSATVFFTTVGILKERPRLGEVGMFSRNSAAYVVDRKGVLQQAADHIGRMNWSLTSGIWRRTLLIEAAATNKVYRNTDFSDDLTTGWAKSGDAAATLTVVDDTAKIQDVGLLPWVTDGKVLKLDNSAGSTAAQAQNNGTVGNLNKHSVSAFIRGDAGNIAIESSGASFGASTTYRRVRYENVTPAATGDNFVIDVAAGDVVYFILAQMEEAGFTRRSTCASLRAWTTRGEWSGPCSRSVRVTGPIRGCGYT
jgi:hypothetical protein